MDRYDLSGYDGGGGGGISLRFGWLTCLLWIGVIDLQGWSGSCYVPSVRLVAQVWSGWLGFFSAWCWLWLAVFIMRIQGRFFFFRLVLFYCFDLLFPLRVGGTVSRGGGGKIPCIHGRGGAGGIIDMPCIIRLCWEMMPWASILLAMEVCLLRWGDSRVRCVVAFFPAGSVMMLIAVFVWGCAKCCVLFRADYCVWFWIAAVRFVFWERVRMYDTAVWYIYCACKISYYGLR